MEDSTPALPAHVRAASESASDNASATTTITTTPSDAAAVRSRFDSRSLQQPATTTTHDQDDNDDGFITTARYLTHQNQNRSQPNAASMTFEEAFAAIKQTTSYTASTPPAAAASTTTTAVAPPSPAGNPKDASTVVLVSRRQTGNPLLKAIKNVSLEFRDGLVPDYVVNESCCILFLSVRYHLLHNGYLDDRLQRVKKEGPSQYNIKIVLCMVDVDDNEIALREINRVVLLSQYTLILSWSWQEAARYVETFKAYENKSATLIKEKVEAEFLPQANDVLTTIRSVNKTDVVTLLTTFQTPKGIMQATLEELSLCPGIGAKKVKQLLATFQEPFTKQ